MKSKIILLAALAGLVFASSCKKDKTETPFAKVQSVTNYDYDGSLRNNLTYVYDDQGRISRESYSDGSYTSYQYTSTTVTKTSYSRTGVVYEKEVYTLNTSGLAISSVDSTYSTLGTTTTKTGQKYTFTYDAAGYLVKTTTGTTDASYVTAETTTNTITASNIATVADAYTQTPVGSTTATYSTNGTTVYQFLTDKTNTIGSANFGITFLGAQSANLTASGAATSSYTSGGTTVTNTPSSVKFTYEYNDNGFVSKVTTVKTYGTGTSASSSASVSTYTYR